MEYKYGFLTILQLKNLLRERGASLRGKKKDLVERLTLYDAHDNFSIKPFASRTHFEDKNQVNRLFVPDSDIFKDLNADSNLPPFTMLNVTNYLERYDTNIEKGNKLYLNKFLLLVRMAFVNNNYYFTAQCKASMKKAIVYNIVVHISLHGLIEACQCDCSVGEPPNAHCKHVVAVLLSLEELKREKKINLFSTCTEKLQSFHRPQKSFFGSPIKIENMPQYSFQDTTAIFDPVAPVDNNKYSERIRNSCVNYIGHFSSTMSYKYTIEPANIYAIENDHNYISSYKIKILEDLQLLNVNQNDIQQIEAKTRNQEKDKYWHELRKTHLTASNFYGICKTVSVAAKINLAKRIMDPTIFKNKQTQHGKDCELKAIAIYESYGVCVRKCGLIIMKEKPFLGASPDGLIGSETVLEVKCPYNQRFSLINEITIPYLKLNSINQLYLEPIHPYYFQIQGQLMVTGRKYANLLVYTYKDWKIIDVPRNEEFINQLQRQLESFYCDYFEPAIIEKYLYKNCSRVQYNI